MYLGILFYKQSNAMVSIIYYLHRENYDMRYYKTHWRKLFPHALKESGILYEIIEGPTNNPPVPKGHIYNEIYTYIYKFTQLQKLLEALQRGTVPDKAVFFFPDLWFPGLGSLAYIRDSMKLKFYIVGVLHAGTFTKGESRCRFGMTPWARPFEQSLVTFCDKIFLASRYIKKDILSTLHVEENKLVVTRLPFDFDLVYSFRKNTPKENLVVFPHRLDSDKGPEIITALRNNLPSHTGFVAAHKKRYTKGEYFKLLARAKVCISASVQENFGYAMLEGTTLGCIPIVPNRCVYPELYPKEYLYNTPQEAIQKVKFYLSHWVDPFPKIETAKKEINNSIPKMLGEIKTLGKRN